MLLDEPFSSLDVELRTSMRREVVEVLGAAGATAILVTHDQDEALSIADRVAVLQHGTIVQCDEPGMLYTRPVNGEVARFVGHGNLLLGRLENGVVRRCSGRSRSRSRHAGDGAVRGRRARAARADRPRPRPTDGRVPRGVVVSREFHGHDVLVAVRLDEPAWGPDPAGRPGFEVLVRLPGPQAPEPGERVSLRVRGTAAAWLTRARLRSMRPRRRVRERREPEQAPGRRVLEEVVVEQRVHRDRRAARARPRAPRAA